MADAPADRFFDYIFQVAFGVLSAVFGVLWFFQRNEIDGMKKGIDEANEEAAAAKSALESHKLFAAETYVRKTELDRQLEQMEKRLGEKLTEKAREQLDVLEEIRDRLPRRH